MRRRRTASPRLHAPGRQASLRRSSSMAQPKPIEAVALAGVQPLEPLDHLLVALLGVQRLVVEHRGRAAAIAPGHERPLVVGARLDAVALGQATTPGALLAGGLVAGPRHDVVEVAEGVEPAYVAEPGCDQHVLVGERKDGPAQQVLHQRTQQRVALGGAAHRGQAHEYARRAADPLERREGEALELGFVTDLCDQHPRLGLLRERADLVAVLGFRAEIGHLDQLSIAEGRAVLRVYSDRHLRPSPRSACGNKPLVQSNDAGRATPMTEHARAHGLSRGWPWGPAPP